MTAPIALFESQLPSVPLLFRGKVRDVYDLGDAILLVATDRLSAFDVVLPTPIPGKGRILTAMSRFWFQRTEDLCENHLLRRDLSGYLAPDEVEQVAGRAVIGKKAKPLKIEAIVRGYLAGTGYKDYVRTGSICGMRMPSGLRESEALPGPVFTPSTKAERGQHDENISFDQATAIIGAEMAEEVRDLSLALYRECAAYALTRGLIVADTKFEFGLDADGRLVVIDEMLTPDSSRFWDLDGYTPGRPQPSYDKQFVRDFLEASGWNKQPPAPALPDEVAQKTAEKYAAAMRKLI